MSRIRGEGEGMVRSMETDTPCGGVSERVSETVSDQLGPQPPRAGVSGVPRMAAMTRLDSTRRLDD